MFLMYYENEEGERVYTLKVKRLPNLQMNYLVVALSWRPE
jgi:hypothetical protein